MLEPLNISDWSTEACAFLNKIQLWSRPLGVLLCVSVLCLWWSPLDVFLLL